MGDYPTAQMFQTVDASQNPYDANLKVKPSDNRTSSVPRNAPEAVQKIMRKYSKEEIGAKASDHEKKVLKEYI